MAVRKHFSPIKSGFPYSEFATLMAVRKDRAAKVESNHRSQTYEGLTGTGISRRGKIYLASARLFTSRLFDYSHRYEMNQLSVAA